HTKMKTRFSTLDIVTILPELRAKICDGWRLNQVYDSDPKTYIFKLNKTLVQMRSENDDITEEDVDANKLFLIIESGQRIHTTDFDWPKGHIPNGFALKLRKHLRNKRVTSIEQMGIDRLIDIQFGSGEAAYHVIVELYDKGNLILTDCNYIILNILRRRKPTDSVVTKVEPRGPKSGPKAKYHQNQHKEEQTLNKSEAAVNDNDSENFRVGQRYPTANIRKSEDIEQLTVDKLKELVANSTSVLDSRKTKNIKNKLSNNSQEVCLRNLLMPLVNYGAALLEYSLARVFAGELNGKKCTISIPIGKDGRFDSDRVTLVAQKIRQALDDIETKFNQARISPVNPGYIVQKIQSTQLKETSNQPNGPEATRQIMTNIDFYPILECAQHKCAEDREKFIIKEFESFDKAVDSYYTSVESQKIDGRALTAEKEAYKRVEHVKLDHQRRLDDLNKAQKEDEDRARLIEYNCDKVEKALLVMRSLIANQMSWTDIERTIKEAKDKGDPIASLIEDKVKFDRNQFTMRLSNPYSESQSSDNDTNSDDDESAANHLRKQRTKSSLTKEQTKLVDIDISLSAYANARNYFDRRRFAVQKERKTIDQSKMAFKNVERQVRQKLKEVVIKNNIIKSRRRYWFEQFYWFLSSDGYLVVAGRDAEQNETLVKRYMKPNDIYVHADLHGASSVVIKNMSITGAIPPKTLVEAGTMAVCYSSAWEAKIATTSWWVYPNQVSKTAPAGEYLTMGAFVIRGKKNFLPLSTLVLGFGFLFKLEDSCIERRVKERLRREALALQETSVNQEQQKASAGKNSNDSKRLGLISHSDNNGEITVIQSSPTKTAKEPRRGKVINGPSGIPDQPGSNTLKKDDEDDGDSVSISDSDSNKDDSADKDHRSKDRNDKPDFNESQVDDRNPSDSEEDDREIGDSREHRLIDSLTSCPTSDDRLMYAIPMCGPYSALQSFKYKVKVIPGTSKRGKAAKASLAIFLLDKTATQHEKDLLKTCKDQDYARNLPNKVKISSQNLRAATKKKKPKKSEVRIQTF
ncbi:Nuclear export mediator factor NEMF, partial [Fragariocoptes setiger]